MRLFRFLYTSIYFGVLGYLVFFARNRIHHRFNYEVNLFPVKNTVDNFLALAPSDKFEICEFYLNLFGNILLFVPFSVILITAFKLIKLRFILLWAAVVSISIEITQYVFQIGFPDIDDVILNVTGALLGFFIYKIFLKLISPQVFLKRNDSFYNNA
ncbi:MAG: VanZ family protein [Ginsengibacter sp.]